MVNVHRSVVERLASFANDKVADIARFADGVTNDTYKVTFRSGHEPVVLRMYQDPSKLQVETTALAKMRGRVPAPSLLAVEPFGVGGIPSFIVLQYISGITFRHFRRQADATAVAEVAHQIGRVLASIHEESPSVWKQPDKPAFGFGGNAIDDSPLLRQRIGIELLRRVTRFVASHDGERQQLLTRKCFTHGDFNNRNVLVRCVGRRWEVAAVVDWECAV